VIALSYLSVIALENLGMIASVVSMLFLVLFPVLTYSGFNPLFTLTLKHQS